LKWLDRSLITGPYLCLALDEASFHKAFNHLKRPKANRPRWILNEYSHATVHTLENADGNLAAVVCLNIGDHTGIQIACLLVHEAVHIWQEFAKRIGESAPSEEFEAYAVQAIAQRLMVSYAEQRA
jgi:hypothetical protein